LEEKAKGKSRKKEKNRIQLHHASLGGIEILEKQKQKWEKKGLLSKRQRLRYRQERAREKNGGREVKTAKKISKGKKNRAVHAKNKERKETQLGTRQEREANTLERVLPNRNRLGGAIAADRLRGSLKKKKQDDAGGKGEIFTTTGMLERN